MHDPVREGLLRQVPDEPWWWPLGPTGITVAMLAGVTWFSATWPLASEILERLRGWMFVGLGISGLMWLGLAFALWQRRQRWLNEPMWVVVDAAGLTLDTQQFAWQDLSACEWSPYGLVYQHRGRRGHFAARVTDAQAERLNEAVQVFGST